VSGLFLILKAIRADAFKIDRFVHDLEIWQINFLHHIRVEREIIDPATAGTFEMTVGFNFDVVSRFVFIDLEGSDQTRVLQNAECVIDGRFRQAGNFCDQGIVDLVNRGVILVDG